MTPKTIFYGACIVASILGIQVQQAQAHSWVECTDYRIGADDKAQTNYWDPSLCKGRPRCSQRQIAAGFGVDTGMNHHEDTCQCPYSESAGTYKQVEMAQYTPGQRVCLAYPPKNHVADTCTNAFIPDAFVKIFRTAKGDTTDSFNKEFPHLNGKHVNGVIDYKGYQNCPKFCEDKDKALCTICFDLENDIGPGVYSFKWQWAFNGDTDIYSTCWEAEVGGPGSAGAATSTSADAPSTNAPSTDVPTSGPTSAPTSAPSTEAPGFPQLNTPAPTTLSATQAPTTEAPAPAATFESPSPAPTPAQTTDSSSTAVITIEPTAAPVAATPKKHRRRHHRRRHRRRHHQSPYTL